MNWFKSLTTLALLSVVCFSSYAADGRPDWTDGYFQDLDYTFIKSVQAEGSTRDIARKNALQQVVADASRETGMRATVQIAPSGEIYVSSADDLTVKARAIDEWCQYLPNGSYRAYLLVQVAKNPTYPYETVHITDKYRFSPDVFIPGMAQLRKGSKAKGILFITAEIVSVGALISCECQRASYESKIGQTHSPDLKRTYIDKANNYANGRNIAIAATCAFYAWNVIDGIIAKGRKHVETGRTPSMAIAPYLSHEGQGLAMQITF
ncbi:MAG: hypothetical protein K2M76_05930 [Muribaculaceae bacterium]|nr:hypothetical protein [Muribaculaceae bacterium]